MAVQNLRAGRGEATVRDTSVPGLFLFSQRSAAGVVHRQMHKSSKLVGRRRPPLGAYLRVMNIFLAVLCARRRCCVHAARARLHAIITGISQK